MTTAVEMATREPAAPPGDRRCAEATALGHLYELVRRRAADLPAAVALGGEAGLGWRTLNGAELLDLTDRLAVELAAEGVGEGDRVVLWLPNGWQTPVYHFALWKLGAVVVPFDREMNPEGGARILDSVEPKQIVVGYPEHPVWAGGRPLLPWWEPGNRCTAASASPSWRRPAEDLAMVVFTSGTTGTPKGCEITHGNLLSLLEPFAENVPLDADCRLASILPLSHLYELTCGLLYPLAHGAAIHHVPSRRAPDILRVFNEQRITHMIAVPQILTLMGQALDRELRSRLPEPVCRGIYALADRLPFASRRRLFWPLHRKLGGEFRLAAAGGAPLPVETQRLWERFGVRIAQGYGTSECSPVIASGMADGSTPAGSVGKPVRGVEVRLGTDGEIMVRGPNVMRGYWRDPVRTAETFRDGWYLTGDLARADEAGNIFIIGRAKDLIALPSGMKVWPQDVEDVLRSHPSVKDAAVIAVAGRGGGASLHAYLIPHDAALRGADPAAIMAVCNARLALHQRVATASWWPSGDFPRTSTLKVRRHMVPPPSADTVVKLDSVLAADDPVAQTIAAVAHASAVRSEQTLASLGVDSLTLVDLALSLEEKTGKVVADGDLSTEMSVEQVRQFLLRAPSAEEVEAGAHTPEQAVPLTGLAGAVVGGSLWPYSWWGRRLRFLDLPMNVVYRYAITRTVVLGEEHLADLPPRVIFAGTHHGFPDFPLLQRSLMRTPARRFARRFVIAAESEMGEFAKSPGWAGFSILAFGVYPLQRRSRREESLRGLARLAALGNAVLIFPQGTHVRPEQERAGEPVARFRPGVAHLARALDAAVVPFGVAGTELRIPPDAEAFRGPKLAGIPVSIDRGPLAIAYGAPLRPEPDEPPAAFTSRLEAVCFDLTHQAEAALARA